MKTNPQCPENSHWIEMRRLLYALYNPLAQFDDIALCNIIGVYKNGGSNATETVRGIFDEENAYLRSLKPKGILPVVSENNFSLYPNPASTTISIAYLLKSNEKGNVFIYDILGREQLNIDLHYTASKVSASISSLQTGIYTFKYHVNNIQREAGKLIIE